MAEGFQKGRGAQLNTHNQYNALEHVIDSEYLEYCRFEEDEPDHSKTKFLEVFPKSIVNKVNSSDLRMSYSLNPYQGCEHGCVYCYARNSHQYWGYSAGLDFERQILVKKEAPQRLRETLSKKNWQPDTIVFSGNTDCYQPIERKLAITRQCLQVMLDFKHPTGIITKNALVLRDLDILKALAQHKLIKVNISITSLSEDTRRLLEPRTSSIKNRLKAVEILAKNNIPVGVMIAPIIPGINSHELFPLLKRVAEIGAYSANYSIVRLNGPIAQIFEDWIRKTMPDRADKVLNQIKACHGGNLEDLQLGRRMRGEGKIAQQIAQEFKIARQKYMPNRHWPELDKTLFTKLKNPQYSLF